MYSLCFFGIVNLRTTNPTVTFLSFVAAVFAGYKTFPRNGPLPLHASPHLCTSKISLEPGCLFRTTQNRGKKRNIMIT